MGFSLTYKPSGYGGTPMTMDIADDRIFPFNRDWFLCPFVFHITLLLLGDIIHIIHLQQIKRAVKWCETWNQSPKSWDMKIPPALFNLLVGQGHPSEKYEFVNWDD